MAQSITRIEARERIASLLERLGHAEAAGRVRQREYVYVELSSGLWADEATIQIREQPDFNGSDPWNNTEVTYRVEINSVTTIRTVAQSLAFLDTFQEAIRIAAKVQALVENFPKVLYAMEPPEADFV